MAAQTLEARSLSKRFGERVALRDVSFQLAGGEILAVIGPNGAGKTTLLSLLAGAAAPSGGEVIAPEGERIGWVPQHTAVYSKLSVLENLRLFARLERVADPEAAVALMLEQTGLRERAGEQLGRLSGGNRQRVNIAIGLLAQPAVALLDEPSGGARSPPARAAVAVHRRPRAGRHEHRLRDPRHRRGRALRGARARAGRRRAALQRLARRSAQARATPNLGGQAGISRAPS